VKELVVAEEYRSSRNGEEEGESEVSGGRFVRKVRVCQFCAEKIKSVDYKQVDLLRRYITERGKIRPRRQTGACAKHQRMVNEAIKRARQMALLPYNAGVP
jgi:small subunit ribosomal protein S18